MKTTMTTQELEKLRFPLGEYECPEVITAAHLTEWIAELKQLPVNLQKLTQNITENQLNTPYRPGGWTVRQVVHHLADSHINALLRFKFALTEDNPTIKPYPEDIWATLVDYTLPIESSIQILTGVHHRLVTLLNHLQPQDMKRTYYHPGYQKTFLLDEVIGLYAWHSRHHLAHIQLGINQA
jgi:hypothetical protein